MGTINVLYANEARKVLNEGVQKLVKAVGSSLGANGSNVMIVDNLLPPSVSKDGVKIAEKFRLYNFVENAGADVVKQAARASADIAGDGTTTATILAGAMIAEGIDLMEGSKKFSVRQGMNKAVKDVIENLKKYSVDITGNYDSLLNIATISANNDANIGKIIADVMYKFGKDARITISKEKAKETKVIERVGYTFERGMFSEMLTQVEGDMISTLENAKLLILDGNLNTMTQVAPVIQHCKDKNEKLVIMANLIGHEFMRVLLTNIANKYLSTSEICVVETPNVNDRRMYSIKDLARCTGAMVYSADGVSDNDIKNFTPQGLGNLATFVSDDVKTTLTFNEEGVEEAKKIASELTQSLEKISDPVKEDIIKTRIERLSTGVAVIQISAKTDVQHEEMYDIFEDSLLACRSALEEGFLEGGGIPLLRASNEIETKGENEDEEKGINIIKQACVKPFQSIIESVGIDYQETLDKIKNSGFTLGYDAKNNEFVNMVEQGIIDPLKVTRVALESALSASTTILTTEAIIFPYDFEDKNNNIFNFH